MMAVLAVMAKRRLSRMCRLADCGLRIYRVMVVVVIGPSIRIDAERGGSVERNCVTMHVAAADKFPLQHFSEITKIRVGQPTLSRGQTAESEPFCEKNTLYRHCHSNRSDADETRL